MVRKRAYRQMLAILADVVQIVEAAQVYEGRRRGQPEP